MSLHIKSTRAGDLDDEIFATREAATVLPKSKFPRGEQSARATYQLVHDELMLDGNARQNLATFARPGRSPRCTA